MIRVYYDGTGYTCPMCGGSMIPSGGGDWECSECDIPGKKTWDNEEKTGYLDIDEEAWDEYLSELRKETEKELEFQFNRFMNEK